MEPENLDLRTSYDRVAEQYAERIFHELEHKPLDRCLLDQFAERVHGLGTVCDMGCGPGHVARYLQERGVPVCGIDLSSGMLAQARRLNPEIEFRQGTMLALEVADEELGGIVAFYSLIHIPRAEMDQALQELKRVLRPGGWMLVAFHVGEESIHRDELWGEKVCMDFLFFRPEEMQNYLTAAGFEVMEVIKREPYEDVEHPSRRAYIFAGKPHSRQRRNL